MCRSVVLFILQSELIQLRGYKSEQHDVITEDGYNLTLFRLVPSVTPSPVVLIQHGLTCSSDCFVTDEDALGKHYLLLKLIYVGLLPYKIIDSNINDRKSSLYTVN